MTFQELLEQLHIPTAPSGHHHTRQGWIQIDCPFCARDSHKWHMGYSIEGNFTNCWRCGSHSVFETIQAYDASREAYILIQQLKKIKPTKKPTKAIGKFQKPLNLQRRPCLAHKKYLKKRGFDYKEIQALWKIQYVGIGSSLRWRIWMPIYYQAQIVSWTSRSIGERTPGPRYISAKPTQESLQHQTLLYGEDYCRHAIVIVEGPCDVWNIGPGAVATFGTNMSSEQVLKMTAYPVRAVCFDPEPEAQKKARELRDRLSVYPGETMWIELPEGKDPGNLNRKEVNKIRKAVLE